MKATLPAAMVLALLACPPASAQESRAFNPIARPAAPPALPDGAIRVAPPRPVDRARIEAAVATVAKAWSDRAVDAVLAPGFDRRAELADAMQTKVPRDASLRVIGIQGWQVHDQYRLAGALVTKVSVTVRTQVEFNDAALGFQARDGTNEYLLTLNDAEAR